jgi:hypothetical protein
MCKNAPECTEFPDGAFYSTILDHQELCQFQEFRCPFHYHVDPVSSREQLFQRKDLQSHIEACPFALFMCKGCNTKVSRKDQDAHDCVY